MKDYRSAYLVCAGIGLLLLGYCLYSIFVRGETFGENAPSIIVGLAVFSMGFLARKK